MKTQNKTTIEFIEEQIKIVRPQVHSYLVRTLYKKNIRDMSVAEDALSDAIFKAIKHMEHYNPELSFKNWFFRIAINALNDALKKNSLSNVTMFSAIEGKLENDPLEFFNAGHNHTDVIGQQAGPAGHDAGDVAKQLESKMHLEAAIKLVESLPDSLKIPLFEHAVNQKSYDEIADQLGITHAAVAIRICRAKKKVRALAEHAQIF